MNYDLKRTADDAQWPRIAEMFAGRSVLVTGGTGFMGKVLIEKLLYSCQDVAKIYVLLRPKRGKAEETRVHEMFKLPLFARVRAERPGAVARVVAIPGDISVEDLGLSSENRALLQRDVSIVFHCAATLKLEAPLKDALQMNTCGTARMLELAKGMDKLMAFVHLSTAFCHVDELLLEERTYPPLFEPEDIMRSLHWMTDEMLESVSPKLLPPHPNTYTFSKRLAETLVERAAGTIPVAIVRPSIVTPAWKEPMPGWVDNLNGPVGLLVGAGKGVIRSMHCKADYHAEMIPVDFAINGLVAAAWRRACDTRKEEIQVYNVTQARSLPVTWGEILAKGRRFIYEYPFEGAVWYPDGDIRNSRFVHNLCMIFLHFLPALLIDGLLTVFGQKRFMVRIQRRIRDGLNLLQYFTTREWVFENTNFTKLSVQMKEGDKDEFFTDCSKIEIEDYLKTIVVGARQYCMKEDLSTLPASRRHIRRLYWLEKFASVLFYGFLIYWVLSWSESAMEMMDNTSTYVKEGLTGLPFTRHLASFSAMLK